MGDALSPDLRQALHELLLAAPGQLGNAYAAQVKHPGLGTTELWPHTGSANSGALHNRLAVVRAVFDGQMPGGPSIAKQVAGSVRTLLKRPLLREDVQSRLTNVLTSLEELAGDANVAEKEIAQLDAQSVELRDDAERKLHDASGVYVYTYPHYWKYPYVPGTQRRLLKVGQTDSKVGQRIRTQARETGAPENPLLLRVYLDDSVETEKTFHTLLWAAEHGGSDGVAAGVEWFSTTLEFCDAIALALRLEILPRDGNQVT